MPINRGEHEEQESERSDETPTKNMQSAASKGAKQIHFWKY